MTQARPINICQGEFRTRELHIRRKIVLEELKGFVMFF
jgi:hypothetical protein